MKKQSREIIAFNISKFRSEKGISREMLSRRMGISPSYIQRIEEATVGLSPDTLDKFADTLRIEPYKFLIDWSSEEIREAIKEADENERWG
ncbi:helix-turn-helix transcriptional regulator [Mycobacteroides abscessus]|uniref:helix-turn-helix domain-containing protein n=1 Tax=unclassified Desemzia TaxID=2685243 RepID=UPI0013FCF9F5